MARIELHPSWLVKNATGYDGIPSRETPDSRILEPFRIDSGRG
jgi:hypothetical protein